MFRILFFLFTTSNLCFGKIYIVDNKKEVRGKRSGTLQRPFETIKDCVGALQKPGRLFVAVNKRLTYLHARTNLTPQFY